jgi:hypothetical protein
MGMNSAIYKALEPSNASWTCCQCGIPNFSTSLFESVIVESNNIYDSLRNQSVLSNTSLDNGNMRSPLHTSSPNHQANQRSKFPHNRNIRFATINFQSINAKKHSFWNFLDSSNPDIICGNETWLKPSICNSEILPDESDYEIFRKDRKDGFGGVMLAIKSNINSNPIDITTVTDCDCEIIARKIECDSNKSLIVISAYRPPNSSIEYSKDLSNIISDICHKNTKSTIWIGGDLNLPDSNWSSNTITSI